MIYLICYDISNPKRLQKTAKVLENYGIRIQRSFFQCEMSSNKLESLKNEVLSIIKQKKDYFFIYPLCRKCSKKATIDGLGKLILLEDYIIL